ncbi:MAG: hypothetical protein ACXWNR_06710, partial [Candidatus Limnocylindrales bacterium]
MFTRFANAPTAEGTRKRSPRKARLAFLVAAAVLALTTAMTVFAATARVSTPAAAAPGAQITVSGTGFAAGQSGKLTFNGSAVTTFKASSSGAFNVPFVVPGWAVVNSTGRISAKTSSDSLIATTTLTIAASVVPAVAHPTLAAPTQAMPGTQITLDSAGFAAGQTGNLSVNGVPVTTFTAAPDGTFSVPFAIPATTTIGMGLIAARDGNGVALATTWLGIGVDVTGPMISVPSQAPAGSTIWVDGLFFGPGQAGNLTYNGGVITQFTAATRGSFGVQFVIPTGAVKGSTGRISAKTSSGSLLATTTLTIGAVAPNPMPTAPPNPTANQSATPTVQPTPGATPATDPTATPMATPTQA